MAELVPFPGREVAIDLRREDIDAMLECANSLPGQWGAKIVRMMGSKDLPKVNWGYLFRRGPTDDASPAISITRTTAFYTVISWDLIEFAADGSFPEYCTRTIDESLAAVRQIVASLAGTQNDDVAKFGRLGDSP